MQENILLTLYTVLRYNNVFKDTDNVPCNSLQNSLK